MRISMSRAFSLLLVGALLLAGRATGAVVDPADVEYRVTVLVRDFASPGAPPDTGQLAAEAVAAAIEE